jgi:glycosyltransferase involved in cell wall biosynthesis
MAPPKRPDLLLHALALLRTQHGLEPPTTIVGDGPDLAAHQALAQQLHLHHVVFTGERDDVAHCLAQHQVFVLLSEHEGLPISILEAMRAGLAILASDLPGLRELLPTPSHGVLVENTPAAVATALQRLLHDGPLRQQLAQRARLRYEQAHSPAHMAQAVLNVYRTLAP